MASPTKPSDVLVSLHNDICKADTTMANVLALLNHRLQENQADTSSNGAFHTGKTRRCLEHSSRNCFHLSSFLINYSERIAFTIL